jgi:hypothetical protein
LTSGQFSAALDRLSAHIGPAIPLYIQLFHKSSSGIKFRNFFEASDFGAAFSVSLSLVPVIDLQGDNTVAIINGLANYFPEE